MAQARGGTGAGPGPLPVRRRRIGPPGAPAHRLVLLHGFTQSGATWDPVADALDPLLGVPVELLAPDLPGHGAAAGVDLDLWGAADAVAAGLGGPAVVVGYSMGGRVALHLALAHPAAVAGLVLVSTSAGIEDPAERAARRASDEELAARAEADGVEAFVRWWLGRPLFSTLAPEAAAVGARLGGTAAGLASSLRLAGAGAMDDLWGRLGEVAAPTLVVTGALDAAYTSRGERLAAAIPGATLEVVAGAGHSVPLERPAELADLLARWLVARGPGGGGGRHRASPSASSPP